MFLLDAVVLRATRELQAERVAIELETAFGVADHNRGVVYPEKESIGRLLPAHVAFARRKPDDLQYMVLRVAKVERLDSTRVWIPRGQRLRCR